MHFPSILGMYLFGGKFCNYVDEKGVVQDCGCEMLEKKDERCQCDRKHFNNILWATVTVFQVRSISIVIYVVIVFKNIMFHYAVTMETSMTRKTF